MRIDDLPALPHWDRPPEDVSAAIVEIKAAIRSRIRATGRTVADVIAEFDEFIEGELADIERDRDLHGSVWPEIDFEDIDSGVGPTLLEQLRRRGCLVVRGHFPAGTARGWDRQIEEYVTANGFSDAYTGPGDDFFATVGSRPAIYPIYWSKPQMEARQSPRMATVQRFLNRLWANRAVGQTWFDPNHSLLYPDRIRRRPPGTTNDGLGAHVDTGNVDIWTTSAFQESFRKVFAGQPLEHDPWNGAHRSDAPKFPGSTMCSVFRTFQGWTALSQMRQDQGVLHVVPIPLSIARLLLRPLMDDVADDDLCGAAVNQVLPVTTQWHERVLDGLSPVPDLEPGDSVWWHADLIHSVAPVSNQDGWASVMYIPAAPWNARNSDYAKSVRRALLHGNSPDDFPAEHYEATWGDRFRPEELNELGRAGLGML